MDVTRFGRTKGGGCTRASGMRAGVECAGSVFARICILFAVV